MQSLYANNKGDNVLSLTMNKKPVAGNDDQDGLFASAVYEKATNTVIVKVVNVGDKAQDVTLNLQGMKGSHEATRTVFTSPDLTAENSIEKPELIKPTTASETVTAPNYSTSIPAKTFVMLRIKK